MSDLYINLTSKPDFDVPGRSCSICQMPISTKSAVYMPKSMLTVCSKCATEMYNSLAPKAPSITIRTSKPVRGAVGSRDVFNTERFKQNFVREAGNLLLALFTSKR